MKIILISVILILANINASAQTKPHTVLPNIRRIKTSQRETLKHCQAHKLPIINTGAVWEWRLAAELNQYPGPLHVLELAEKLELNPQAAKSNRIIIRANANAGGCFGKTDY